jgi:hypothetical protein
MDDDWDYDESDSDEEEDFDEEDNDYDAQCQAIDEELKLISERLLMAVNARLNELRGYAKERKLDQIQLLIPYCNPVYQCVDYLIDFIDSEIETPDLGIIDNLSLVNLLAALYLIWLSEHPETDSKKQAKEYNVDCNFDTANDVEKVFRKKWGFYSESYKPFKNNAEKVSKKMYPLFSKFCMRYDPFKDFNQVFLKLKDDDRAISLACFPQELEVKLGDIKQQLSLKNDFNYIGMIDYKTILPLSELEKYRETKGYLGKKVIIEGINYIVWVTEEEVKKLGEICNQLDRKLEIFKQEYTKLANQFKEKCTELQEKHNQEVKMANEKYEKKKKNYILARTLVFLLSIAVFGISRIMWKESFVYGAISGCIIMMLGLLIFRKPMQPEAIKEEDTPPENHVNNKASDIFIDILSRVALTADDRVQIGSAELSGDNGTAK